MLCEKVKNDDGAQRGTIVVRDGQREGNRRARRNGRPDRRRHAQRRWLREAGQRQDRLGRCRQRVEPGVVHRALQAALVDVVAHQQRTDTALDRPVDGAAADLCAVLVEPEVAPVVGRGDVGPHARLGRCRHARELARREPDDELELLVIDHQRDGAVVSVALAEEGLRAIDAVGLHPCGDRHALGERERRLVRHIDQVTLALDGDPQPFLTRRALKVHVAEGGVALVRGVLQLGALAVAVVEAPEADRYALARATAHRSATAAGERRPRPRPWNRPNRSRPWNRPRRRWVRRRCGRAGRSRAAAGRTHAAPRARHIDDAAVVVIDTAVGQPTAEVAEAWRRFGRCGSALHRPRQWPVGHQRGEGRIDLPFVRHVPGLMTTRTREQHQGCERGGQYCTNTRTTSELDLSYLSHAFLR